VREVPGSSPGCPQCHFCAGQHGFPSPMCPFCSSAPRVSICTARRLIKPPPPFLARPCFEHVRCALLTNVACRLHAGVLCSALLTNVECITAKAHPAGQWCSSQLPKWAHVPGQPAPLQQICATLVASPAQHTAADACASCPPLEAGWQRCCSSGPNTNLCSLYFNTEI